MSDYFDYAAYWDMKAMSPAAIAESCEQAADLLEGHWTRGAWAAKEGEGPDGEMEVVYCVEGGLAAALGINAWDVEGDSHERTLLRECPVYGAVVDTLNARQETLPDGSRPWYDNGDLPEWNDSENCNEQEVLDLLRATAKRVLGVEP